VPAARSVPPAGPRQDLLRLQQRGALLTDAARPEAMARRHASGLRSARENVTDLLDPGSFTEYGALAVAAQRSRRSLDDLQRNTPADGLITGTGCVDGRRWRAGLRLHGAGRHPGHEQPCQERPPAGPGRAPAPAHRVVHAEGGGGRPGDVDRPKVAGLHCTTFGQFAALSGVVPRIGVVAGRCFAGNAALLGSSDVIIAVEGASIGMGGPAMIEGGGLGKVEPMPWARCRCWRPMA
jgi:acetyl-CoA carboxylase carboxyltransferase component